MTMTRHHVRLAQPWEVDPDGVRLHPRRGDVVGVAFLEPDSTLAFDLLRVELVMPGGRWVCDKASDICRDCGEVLAQQALDVVRSQQRYLVGRPARVVAWAKLIEASS